MGPSKPSLTVWTRIWGTDQEYDKALEYIDRTIQMKELPDDGLSFNRGLILLAQGKIQEAEAVYDRTLARARTLDRVEAISQAALDARTLVDRKRIPLAESSPILKLIRGNPGLAA